MSPNTESKAVIVRGNLIEARTRERLTQVQTAQAIGVTARQYARIEAATSDGSIKVWLKLKELPGTPIDTLLEDTTNEA